MPPLSATAGNLPLFILVIEPRYVDPAAEGVTKIIFLVRRRFFIAPRATPHGKPWCPTWVQGTAAPEGSFTVPVIEPVFCAPGAAEKIKTKKLADSKPADFIVTPSRCGEMSTQV